MKDLSYGFAWKWLLVKISQSEFFHFLCNFLGWISLYNFRRLLKNMLKIASWHKIKPRVFEKQFFDISSVRFFNLVVLNRFLMSNSYFMLNSKSLRILICHDFWQKTAKNYEKPLKWSDFHPKWWQIKILRLLQLSMKYESDIRNLFRTTKLKNRTDEMSKNCFSKTLGLILCQLAIFSSFLRRLLKL